MPRTALLIALAASACGKSAPSSKGTAKDCFAYTMPGGWALQPSKTGADIVLAGPDNTPVGDKLVGDTFIIRFFPLPGSLAELKTQMVAKMNKANVDQAMSDLHHAHPDLPEVKADVPPMTVTDTTVGGREAFRIEVKNTITVDGSPVTNIGSTYFVKFGSEVVSIATGYLAPREAAMKPLAAAFVTSINFDRCK